MRTPTETEFQREVSQGVCRLIVDDVDGLKAVFDRVAYHKLNLGHTVRPRDAHMLVLIF